MRSQNTDWEDDGNKKQLEAHLTSFFFRKSGFHLNSRGDFFFGSIIVYYKIVHVRYASADVDGSTIYAQLFSLDQQNC